MASEPVRVVILGGGFGGITAARELIRRGKRDALEIHLVSNENYFLFHPMLPEVVSGSIEPSHILNPIRQFCEGAHFHCATVTGISTATRTVTLMGADTRRVIPLRYDHLVIALGMTVDPSRVPGLAEHSLPLKTLGDAFHLRNHILTCLEEAEIEQDSMRQRKLLTFMVVGGGFSGVETAAEINDMVRSALHFYPRAKIVGCRVMLIHSSERVLPELDAGLATFAQEKLTERGVELKLNRAVREMTPEGALLSSGERLESGTVVCTIGTAPRPLIRESGLPQERGRLLVDGCLRIRDYDNLWALGDAALVPDSRRGGWCPPTAQYAMREGVHCARNIMATLRNEPVREFAFRGFGQLAVVGQQCGVAQVRGIKLSGYLAWWLWRSVYLMKLPGVRCKIRVGLDWLLHSLFHRDITKLDMRHGHALGRAHYAAGETIVRQGEIGDRFYIVESGSVEIVQEQPDGAEERLSVRNAGESFGELALLHDAPRSASVRCLTPVDVLTFSRPDFLTLVGSYQAVRSHVDQEASRHSPPRQPVS